MNRDNQNINSLMQGEEYREAERNDCEGFSSEETTIERNVIQTEQMHPNFLVINSNVSDLLASFQKMRAEEQRLLELKQQIIAKQNDLQNRLVKEIEKKKTTIANLTSEIPDLQNRNQQLEQALGVLIYTRTQILNKDSPQTLINTKSSQALPGCLGFLKCLKPENCKEYESCLEMYMGAEIRNDVLNLSR